MDTTKSETGAGSPLRFIIWKPSGGQHNVKDYSGLFTNMVLPELGGVSAYVYGGRTLSEAELNSAFERIQSAWVEHGFLPKETFFQVNVLRDAKGAIDSVPAVVPEARSAQRLITGAEAEALLNARREETMRALGMDERAASLQRNPESGNGNPVVASAAVAAEGGEKSDETPATVPEKPDESGATSGADVDTKSDGATGKESGVLGDASPPVETTPTVKKGRAKKTVETPVTEPEKNTDEKVYF